MNLEHENVFDLMSESGSGKNALYLLMNPDVRPYPVRNYAG